jgi:4-hydroxybenzoate polyprenyltransferase
METSVITHQKTFSSGFVRDYIITMRPYLLFVSGITGLLGMSFLQDLSFVKSLLIFLASFLSYGFGQALTDVFQTDTDSISSPYRPLTQGRITKAQVLLISLFGLVFCISVFSFYNPINLLLGIISGIGLATYTFFKKRFWAGPFYNAWIVGCLFLMALFCGVDLQSILSNPAILLALLSVFWGYANFVLVGYFKDVEADRKTGYNTLLVVYGRKVASVFSNSFGLVTIVFVLISFNELQRHSHQLSENIFASLILIAGIAAMMLCQIIIHFVKRDDESGKAISLSVHAYILLLMSIIILNKNDWVIPVIMFYGLFNFTMSTRPAKNQI